MKIIIITEELKANIESENRFFIIDILNTILKEQEKNIDFRNRIININK